MDLSHRQLQAHMASSVFFNLQGITDRHRAKKRKVQIAILPSSSIISI